MIGMATFIKSVTFDCQDALGAARFWAATVGSNVDEGSTPKKAYIEAPGWGGPNVWFNWVPEAKIAKNRLHFDLRAPGLLADEVRRLIGLGAVVVHAATKSWSCRTPKATYSASNSDPVAEQQLLPTGTALSRPNGV